MERSESAMRWLQRRMGLKFFNDYYKLVFAFARFDKRISCFNYGYAHLPSGQYEDVAEKYQIEMYRQVALAAGDGAIAGKNLLEISSGLGGGLNFVTQTFRPRLSVGLEKATPAVLSSRRRFDMAVIEGDACDLRLPDGSFDVVINVEASHVYFTKGFLNEAGRVLSDGGTLVIADSRRMSPDEVRTYIKDSAGPIGLILESFRDITDNVTRSNELDDPRRELLLKRAPFFCRGFFRAMLGGPTTENYRYLKDRRSTYFIATFKKQDSSRRSLP